MRKIQTPVLAFDAPEMSEEEQARIYKEHETMRAERNRRARQARKAREDALRSLGLTKCRVNGETIWE